ncbi:MAG: hypothetical protein HOK84_04765 [Bacteroidetes bacterium]|jgi:hypothetical protein|nr:hypothetical protein [Bacteroidota bacterium]
MGYLEGSERIIDIAVSILSLVWFSTRIAVALLNYKSINRSKDDHGRENNDLESSKTKNNTTKETYQETSGAQKNDSEKTSHQA